MPASQPRLLSPLSFGEDRVRVVVGRCDRMNEIARMAPFELVQFIVREHRQIEVYHVGEPAPLVSLRPLGSSLGSAVFADLCEKRFYHGAEW